MKKAQSTGSTTRHAYSRNSSLMQCSGTISIRIIFTVMHIIFLGWPGFRLLYVRPTHWRSFYIYSVSYDKLREHQGSCHCRLKCQNCSLLVLLFYIISRLLQLFFQLLALFQNKTKISGLEFIADNRPITSSITGECCS